MIEKRIPLDMLAIHELSHAITVYLECQNTTTMNRQSWYAAYILQQFQAKLLQTAGRMYSQRKGRTTVKVDGVQAMILVDVLTSYPSTIALSAFLSEIGKIQVCQ